MAALTIHFLLQRHVSDLLQTVQRLRRHPEPVTVRGQFADIPRQLSVGPVLATKSSRSRERVTGHHPLAVGAMAALGWSDHD